MTTDGSRVELSASADAIDAIQHNLEQLAIRALQRRMERGTDRQGAPRALPALRTICGGFAVEEAEPGDDFEGYRLLASRLSRPPAMLLLRREGSEAFVRSPRGAPIGKGEGTAHQEASSERFPASGASASFGTEERSPRAA
jgi:hypothetical protein